MPAKYFLIIRNYVLSVSLQRKYNFYHQNALLDAFRTNSRSIIGRNPSTVIPLLANQDLTPMLTAVHIARKFCSVACSYLGKTVQKLATGVRLVYLYEESFKAL